METAAQLVIQIIIKVNAARCQFKVENAKFKTLFECVDTVSEIVEHIVKRQTNNVVESKSFRNLQACLEEIDKFLERRLKKSTSDPSQLFFPKQFSWGSHQQDMAEAWLERLNVCLDNLQRFIDICGDEKSDDDSHNQCEQKAGNDLVMERATTVSASSSTSKTAFVAPRAHIACANCDKADGQIVHIAKPDCDDECSLPLNQRISADVVDMLCVVGEGVVMQLINAAIAAKQKWVEGKAKMAACERQVDAMRTSPIYTQESQSTAQAVLTKWHQWQDVQEKELDRHSARLSIALVEHGILLGGATPQSIASADMPTTTSSHATHGVDWRNTKLMQLRTHVNLHIAGAKERIGLASARHAKATEQIARAISDAAIEKLKALEPPSTAPVFCTDDV